MLWPLGDWLAQAVLVHAHVLAREAAETILQVGDKVELAMPDPGKQVKSRCGSAWTVGRDVGSSEVGTIVQLVRSRC